MADRFLMGLTAIIRSLVGNAIVGPRVDYLAAYPCVAVKQNSDGTLELVPDDKRIPGLSNVPIRYGVPGISVVVAPGGRALLEFAAGDPQKPIATLWESASVTTFKLDATTVNLDTGAAQTVNIATGAGSTANIGGIAAQVNLGAALQFVARATDPVQAGPFAGVVLVPTQTVTKA